MVTHEVRRQVSSSPLLCAWKGGLQLLCWMHHASLESEVARFNEAASSSKKSNNWEGALVLLPEMAYQLLMPDLVSCNAAISVREKGKG